MKLSIIIPCYNEVNNLSPLINKVDAVVLERKIKKEIILVDDGSTDGSTEYIKKKIKDNIKKLYHQKNMGKGAAVKTGIKQATGDMIIIQDADLELNPEEYNSLISHMLDNKYSVVYGSRTLNKNNKFPNLFFLFGGKLVTFVTNALYSSKLTDEPTCYKLFKTDLIKKIKIENDRFSWEPEITAKILKMGIEIGEVPISYVARKKQEGKKLRFKDGFEAIWTLLYYRFKR